MKWIVSIPYHFEAGLYCNFVCNSEEEAQELAKQFKNAEIEEVSG